MQSFRTIVSLQLITFDLYCQATCAAALNCIMKAVLGENVERLLSGKGEGLLGKLLLSPVLVPEMHIQYFFNV